MDEEFEGGIFSDYEKDEISQGYFFSALSTPRHSKQASDKGFDLQELPLQTQVDHQPESPKNTLLDGDSKPLYRAFNPMDMIQSIPVNKRKEYMRIANNSKTFPGLQFFYGMDDVEAEHETGGFLEGMNDKMFNEKHEPQSGDLQRLFSSRLKSDFTEKEQIEKIICALRDNMNRAQEKYLHSVSLNKTIGSTFYEHFENFSLVSNPSNFAQDVEINLRNLIQNAKKLRGPGFELILQIYDFWMKTFKDFVNQIWKYSSKYTLNFFKKDKSSQISDRSSEYSASRIAQGSKEKRKNWSSEEILILEKIIDANVIFSQNKLKELSEQLGRSVNSISSKIQKILKSKKGEQYQEESLLKKTIEVLKLSPEGLNKQTTIQKINEYYQMGYDGQWQKSVGQLLSSRKEFRKIKGKFRLLNAPHYRSKSYCMQEQGGHEKLTFKDKVIQCLLQFEDAAADLKSLVEVYLKLYGDQELTVNLDIDERRKSIEASISKTLSRYEIFDNSNARTIYQYIRDEIQTSNSEVSRQDPQEQNSLSKVEKGPHLNDIDSYMNF